MNESTFGPEHDGEIDPFTEEVHTGKRALESAKNLFDNHNPEHFESSIKSHYEKAKLNAETWEKILGELPPHEQQAFRLALAQGLENFYYTHYNAVHSKLDSAPWSEKPKNLE